MFLAVLAAAWGAKGTLDTYRIARAGYTLNGSTVAEVRPGSPAEHAGLRIGDRVTRNEALPPGDPATFIQPRIGESRRMTVRRGDQVLELVLAYEALPDAEIRLRLAGTVAGMALLLACCTVLLLRPGPVSLALAVAGLGAALALFSPPSLEPAGLRTGAGMIRNGLILGGLAAGLHALLMYLNPRRDTAGRRVALYLPPALYWLLLSARMLAGVETPRIIVAFTAVSGGLLFGIYAAIALGMLARAWVRRAVTYKD